MSSELQVTFIAYLRDFVTGSDAKDLFKDVSGLELKVFDDDSGFVSGTASKAVYEELFNRKLEWKDERWAEVSKGELPKGYDGFFESINIS